MANHRRIKTVGFFIVLTAFLLLSIPSFPSAEETSNFPAYRQKTYFPKTSQALTVHFISGPEKGPTLLVFGGIHGDEEAGYLAAERFVHVRIRHSVRYPSHGRCSGDRSGNQ